MKHQPNLWNSPVLFTSPPPVEFLQIFFGETFFMSMTLYVTGKIVWHYISLQVWHYMSLQNFVWHSASLHQFLWKSGVWHKSVWHKMYDRFCWVSNKCHKNLGIFPTIVLPSLFCVVGSSHLCYWNTVYPTVSEWHAWDKGILCIQGGRRQRNIGVAITNTKFEARLCLLH